MPNLRLRKLTTAIQNLEKNYYDLAMAHNGLTKAFQGATRAFIQLDYTLKILVKKGLINAEDIENIKKDSEQALKQLQSRPKELAGPIDDGSPKPTVLPGSSNPVIETEQPASSDTGSIANVGNGD